MDGQKITGFLIDIDGVLYTGDTPVPGAREAIAYLMDQGYPFRCVSNSTRKCRATIAAKLETMGFDIPESAIFTPPLAAVRFMQETGKHRAYLLTTGDVDRDFAGTCTDDGSIAVDYVIVGDAGDRVTYASMNHAFRCLMEGADLIALEKDRYWMDKDGLSLSAGPFVAALESATGKTATVVGKPAKAFFDLALRDRGLDARGVVMIGDDILTDIGGAQGAGMRGVLVRTGKFREDTLENARVKPAAVINSLGDIRTIL
ncbi:TIGR01458 family HAD-type hydrolase [Methanoregula sp.]|jgi:HAD superfamily hydrolase (TIGR01458 family)|uniref:TIGR01458 family HAD-type hydrolase n=1 Tax=Methanoregula sp. TaxID=2052170 RepID=UPI003567CDF4